MARITGRLDVVTPAPGPGITFQYAGASTVDVTAIAATEIAALRAVDLTNLAAMQAAIPAAIAGLARAALPQADFTISYDASKVLSKAEIMAGLIVFLETVNNELVGAGA